MPNTLTTNFKSTPSTEPVEAAHPNTGVYVTGTQIADGTWNVVHTGITKTAGTFTMTGRLKNYPSVAASVVTSGPITNNQQPVPTGLSAISSTTSSINVTANSGANAVGGYRFFSGSAQAGPFTLLATQGGASYAHTGLTSGAVVWYQMQYVGGGFYDDSPVSAAFSGTVITAVAGIQTNDAAIIFINGQSNGQGNAEAAEALFAPMDTFSPNISQSFSTVKIWNVATGIFENMVVGTNTRSDATNTYIQGYTYGAKLDGTWDIGNAAAKYNITGVGPEYGLADAWKTLGSAVPIYIIKFCEGGTSINRWLKSANDLYPKLLAHKQNAFTNLNAAGKNVRVIGFFRNQGEADATMLASDYQTKLTQLYADLTSDGFITSETKIVEVATPTTNDTGTPVTYAAELTAKQNFAAAGANRYVLDAAAVALEHDEIHWNLATQYNYGFVRLSSLFFNSSLTLPVTVTPPAPTLAFNSSTGVVTVTPPTANWPQKEFYYIINGAAPKRLTTTFSFIIPAGVTANAGQVLVYSRAVPGRGQSANAVSTATWAGVTTAPTGGLINWLTASGRYTTQDGSGNTTRLYRSGGANAWDAYAPASFKILAPAAGTSNAQPIASINIPNIVGTQAAVILGVAQTPTVVDRHSLFAAIYADNVNCGLAAPTSANPDNVLTPFLSASPQTGPLALSIYVDRIVLANSAGVVSTLVCTPFSGGTIYVHGIVYGFAGWTTGQQVSQIIGATLTGSTLAAF